ncbi:hypothetical protein BDW67DRAFT_11570 [Aspergillus spinulosporus]
MKRAWSVILVVLLIRYILLSPGGRSANKETPSKHHVNMYRAEATAKDITDSLLYRIRRACRRKTLNHAAGGPCAPLRDGPTGSQLDPWRVSKHTPGALR